MKRWTIGRISERGSGISVLAARQDDNDEWPCRMPYISEMTLTDYMYQEKKVGEDLPALKTGLTHRYNDSKTTWKSGEKEWLPPSETIDNTKANRMTITKIQKWEEKQLYRGFKRLISNISHEKTWTWLRKGNFKRET